MKALEAEGLVIREAGTHQRPSADAFNFNPSPSSPIYGHFSRKSVDTTSIRSKTWRDSTASLAMSDRGTQTDEGEVDSPKRSSRLSSRQVSPPKKEEKEIKDVIGTERHESPEGDRRDSFSDIDSDVEIHEVNPVVMKARAVNVPKRIPPALPPRNPGRVTSPSPLHEESPAETPNDGFSKIDLNGDAPVEKRDSSPDRAPSTIDEDKFESIPNTPQREKEEHETLKKETTNDKDGWGSV